MFDSRLKRKWDNKNVLDYAVEEAVKKARRECAIDMARRMKEYGMPATEIASYIQLSVEEIEKL